MSARTAHGRPKTVAATFPAEREVGGARRPGVGGGVAVRREGDHPSRSRTENQPDVVQNLLSYFESFNDLGRRVHSVGRALGREEIWLERGAHLFFPARTRSTLRGWSIDAYLADEAQLISDEQWESAKPTMSARPNVQAWLFGTVRSCHRRGGVRPAAGRRAPRRR